MKILIILLFSMTSLFGQNISSSDSLKIVEAYQTLFSAIETNDNRVLNEISTDSIYCIICFESPDFSDTPYMLSKKDFLEKHLPKIKDSKLYQRTTKNNDLILIKENDHRTDITALWTIYKRNDELAPRHEGIQFGIYFKKVDKEFRFAGMETIP